MPARPLGVPLMLCLLPATALATPDGATPPAALPAAAVPLAATAATAATVARAATEPGIEAGAAGVAEADAAQDKPLPSSMKSQFRNLRFEEDWSTVATPEGQVASDHWAPELKFIELAEGWTASFGGQFRFQYKSEDNRSLQGTVPGNNDFFLLRERLHGELRYRDDIRFFVELINAGIRANDAAPLRTDRQDTDLQNAFAELLAEDAKLRFGRTEMRYGAERLISPLDWANTRRTFDGAVASLKNDALTTDVFAVKPVPVDPRHADDHNGSLYFAGVYNTWKIDAQRLLDFYGLLLNESHDVLTGGNGEAGNQELYTFGARYFGKHESVDYDFEAARQFGAYADDSVRAGMWTAVGGYTFNGPSWKPRLGLDLDYASGDSNPTDGKRETFNQLFPLGHRYFGFLDLIGRQNIMQVQPNASCRLTETTALRVSYSDFKLANKHDSLYGANGAPVLTDTSGANGDDVGKEIDVTLDWTPGRLAPHSAFQFGYSTFKPDRFVEALGDGNRAHLLYLQYTFTF